ncbi:hypothetical protein ACIGDI_34025 [Streptomyces sp. NPDC085900]
MAATRMNSTVMMSAPMEHCPTLHEPSPSRAVTVGPSTRATRR